MVSTQDSSSTIPNRSGFENTPTTGAQTHSTNWFALLKLPLLIAGVLLFVSISVLVAKRFVQAPITRTTLDPTAETLMDIPSKEIATDPSFKEVKGSLIPGFPNFPVYADAELKGSATLSADADSSQGYRVIWELNKEDSTVPEVMNWYQRELTRDGWKYEAPDDPTSVTEQVAQISKGNFKGYLAAEIEQNELEILVQINSIE